MNTFPAEMNALLGSRICHDLISPIGAIGNGVELLQMSGVGNSAELSLISESVENANARIRLFRVAFGAAAPDQRIARREVEGILASMGASRGIDFHWPLESDILRDEARLIFLLLLCCESALPRGGGVTVETGHGPIAIACEAERLRVEEAAWRLLEEPMAELPSAADIHFPLARHAAESIGRRIATKTGETRIVLRA